MDPEERLKAVLSDRYRIEREIGSGGMATVYLARDLKHNREVAVKVLDPSLAENLGPERFLREIETAAKLAHPHILPLHDSGEADGVLYYVMPYVRGESLRDRLAKERQLPVEEAVRIAREIAGALAHAHAQGVIHRDVKPANIMLEAGHAVLADFGIAQAVAGAEDDRLTRTGTSLGSPAYMSPEQASGDQALDGRSDQYSLGCVLYEMLVGEPPFTGATTAQILARQLTSAPARISPIRPSVDARIDAVIARALEKIPADRFASVQEFSEALRAAAGAQAPSRAGGDLPRPSTGGKKRRTLRWLVSSVSLVVLAVLGGILLLGSSNDFGFRSRDWILITDFKNNTGEAVFDRSLDNALAVGLQQSNHVNVFPKSRVAQTLERMVRENTGGLGEDLGREVALRENIRLLVAPSIDRVDQTYVLAIRILDASTGEDLLSRSVQAEGTSRVLPALDKLARGLRRDLGEPLYSITRQSVRLGAATTPSLEALEAWSEGNFHWGQRRFDEAVTLYLRALELDSSFAMAHADLAGAYYFEGNRPEGDPHWEKALSLTDRVTERERLWILAEMENHKGNYQGAIDAYNIYLTRYPDDLDGWFRLGYAQMREGQSADAAHAYETVVEMDPQNAAAFINLATSLSLLNRREEAVQDYLKAFQLAPEWRTSGNLNHEFGFNYVEMGAFESAEGVFREMLDGNDDQRAQGNRSLGLMKMYLGRYGEAREHLRQAAVLHRTLGFGLSEMRDRQFLAEAYWASGSTEPALEESAEVRRLAGAPSTAPTWLANVGKDHARMGLAEESEALLQAALSRSDESVEADRAAVALLRGEIGVARGDAQGALDHLETAYALRENAYHLESLAYGLYRAGNLEAARDRYLTLLAEPEIGWEIQEYWLVSHYHLGQIFEQLGDLPKALEYYDALLAIWKDGDPDLTLLQTVRERVEGLRAGG